MNYYGLNQISLDHANATQSLPLQNEVLFQQPNYYYSPYRAGNCVCFNQLLPYHAYPSYYDNRFYTVPAYLVNAIDYQFARQQGQYVYLVRSGELIKMDANTLRPVGRDSGWDNAKLMAASGEHVYLVRSGELIKMDTNTLRPVGRDSGWDNAKLMAASGEHVYLVRSGELIKMDANTLRPVGRDTGWDNATLMAASGEHVYLVRSGELIKMDANTLRPVGRDTGWDNATFMAASGEHVYLVRSGELIKMDANTLRPVGSDIGWDNATLMAASGEHVYLVRSGELIKMDANTLRPVGSDTGWDNANLISATLSALVTTPPVEELGPGVHRNLIRRISYDEPYSTICYENVLGQQVPYPCVGMKTKVIEVFLETRYPPEATSVQKAEIIACAVIATQYAYAAFISAYSATTAATAGGGIIAGVAAGIAAAEIAGRASFDECKRKNLPHDIASRTGIGIVQEKYDQ